MFPGAEPVAAPLHPSSSAVQPPVLDEASDAARALHVRTAVYSATEALLARHPWLRRRQSLIGLLLQLGALGGMAACAAAWLAGWWSAWVAVPLIALCASVTHEIEHDLLHRLYFRRQPWVQDLLLLLGWLARPSTLNPWLRRELHLHHHKASGCESDLEERGIANGERWGLRRLLMTLDLQLAALLRPRTMAQAVALYLRDRQRELARSAQQQGRPLSGLPRARLTAPAPFGGSLIGRVVMRLPLTPLFWTTWHAVLLLHAADWLGAWAGSPPAWPQWLAAARPLLDALAVCLLLPNALRSACLHFISSNMHYYGNVERGNLMQQTQVLNHPLLWPLQLFCCNFGSTHTIHHFVVGQPFYLRQMVAAAAHRAMREAGLPFNDFGSFARANRRASSPARPQQPLPRVRIRLDARSGTEVG